MKAEGDGGSVFALNTTCGALVKVAEKTLAGVSHAPSEDVAVRSLEPCSKSLHTQCHNHTAISGSWKPGEEPINTCSMRLCIQYIMYIFNRGTMTLMTGTDLIIEDYQPG